MPNRTYLTSLLMALFSYLSIAQTDHMPAWTYPYPVHHLTVNDSIDIAYVDEGKGKTTLVFVHGLGSYLKGWTKNIDTLRRHYRCVALDLPGYGKSEAGDYAYDMTFFAETLVGFIRQKRLRNVVLVGHSMGGQIAMHTVLRAPKIAKKLILVAPAGFETFTPQEGQAILSVYTPAVIKATPEAQIVKNFEINFHAMPADARFMIDDRLLLRQSPAYDAYCAMIPHCVAGMLHEPVFERLPEIKLPTLVIYGENDALIPNRFLHPTLTTATVAAAGQSRLPKSQLRMIPAAGHFVQWEQAEGVNEGILEFLKK